MEAWFLVSVGLVLDWICYQITGAPVITKAMELVKHLVEKVRG